MEDTEEVRLGIYKLCQKAIPGRKEKKVVWGVFALQSVFSL